jgi:Arc/MetJ-type ribon-helix-helix transcriptional regulator
MWFWVPLCHSALHARLRHCRPTRSTELSSSASRKTASYWNTASAKVLALNLDCRQHQEYGDRVEGEMLMPITIQPEHERLIADALRSGAYQDSGEVIQRALELLRDRDAWLAENRARIDEGYAAAQRGELIDADQVRIQMEEKKRVWRTQQRKA